MEDEFSAAGCGVNVLSEAFKPNAPLFKIGHRGNQMRQGTA
jgi:hypothetical protein